MKNGFEYNADFQAFS